MPKYYANRKSFILDLYLFSFIYEIKAFKGSFSYSSYTIATIEFALSNISIEH